MNSVSLVGNLATDVELKDVGEKRVASFLLAVGRAGRDGGADFVWISAWDREVELREVGPDKKVASFVLAVDRASADGGADFVSVSAWDRQAELCSE